VTSRSALLALVARTLYPAMLVLSLVVLLRGHDQPGGGFIAGMMAVAATALRAVAQGSPRALAGLPGGASRAAALGAALAVLSGFAGPLVGMPYLTHAWAKEIPVSTVLLFEVGVYLAVWGSIGVIAGRMVGIDQEETD
jgi:multicomponent Na+:H+ antiporter subunit B